MKELAQKILQEAVASRVSDIYVLPADGEYSVTFRRFDTRERFCQLSAEDAASLMAHFKFLAGMNVGEKRRTQMGACLYELPDGKNQRLRLSSVGDFEGRESLVLRLLHDESQQDLDFWYDGEKEAKNLITRRGLYLFSGPVGSGKTTLMYHLAREKFAGKQVITIEDPVEIIEGQFLQLQRNDTIGATYDDLIKLSLRHMPDLVIVGEIRDELTARAVMRASLTGYTVFSTVHAKSVSGVYARLLELGLSPGEIANSLNGVVYQRLMAGKGLLEVAREKFEDYDNANWNAKIARLADDGYLTADAATVEKIAADKAD